MRCFDVMTVALTLCLAGTASARPGDGKLLQFVLDIGAIQSAGEAVRGEALRQHWAPVPQQIQSIVSCERRLQALGGDPSRKQALATLHRDVLLLQAAGAIRDVGRTATSAQAVAADASAAMSFGPRL